MYSVETEMKSGLKSKKEHILHILISLIASSEHARYFVNVRHFVAVARSLDSFCRFLFGWRFSLVRSATVHRNIHNCI